MDETRSKLIHNFKSEVIEACGVLDVNVDQVDDDAVLFDRATLGLDSLDALELVMLIEQHFGLKIKEKEGSTKVFKSFNTVADFILEKAPKDKIEEYIKN